MKHQHALTARAVLREIGLPHCIIEYSGELESQVAPGRLVDIVLTGALASRLFDDTAIKVRARHYDHYWVEGGRMNFVHVTARILSGRSPEQKRQLSATILQELQSLQIGPVSLTVDVVDMERAVYSKCVVS